ncbi:hypothetical protein CRG98_022490 [Punica granatum]|uniref:Uncharacterized protein n=1 Tax=Punica granatum TaxID=22663 RepID=A0A2I0JLG2_PUNGR|nr:hypothetical protein CRG98_022490 [Punica granatum]
MTNYRCMREYNFNKHNIDMLIESVCSGDSGTRKPVLLRLDDRSEVVRFCRLFAPLRAILLVLAYFRVPFTCLWIERPGSPVRKASANVRECPGLSMRLLKCAWSLCSHVRAFASDCRVMNSNPSFGRESFVGVGGPKWGADTRVSAWRFIAFHGLRPGNFTAFHGFRPGILPLSTGFGLAIYRFPRASAWQFYYFPRTSAWHFTAFHGLRLGNLLLSTGFDLTFYRFPRVSAWQFTPFHGLRPGNFPFSTGFDLAFYYFPRVSAWQFTAFHGLRLCTLLLSTGFDLAIYRFPRASAWQFTAFHGFRPDILPLSTGFGLAIYRFPWASALHFIAFHGLRPGNLPLSTGFGLAIYCFPRARALARSLPTHPMQRSERLQGMTPGRSPGPKRGASHDLWLHPLIEHATKEGQAGRTFGHEGTDYGREAGITRKAQKGNQENERTANPENSKVRHCGTIHHRITGASKGLKPRILAVDNIGPEGPSPGAPDFPNVPFPLATSASRAIAFEGSLTTLILSREEVVTVREFSTRAQLPLRSLLLYRLRTFEACHEHLDPSIGSSRNSILLGTVVGASVPTSLFLDCHGRYLSGAHHSPRLAGSPDPLATFPTLFLVHRG